jgi:hypothetical protein
MAVTQLFLVRNSAVDLPIRNIAELRRCGLKLRMPTFANNDNHFASFFLRKKDPNNICFREKMLQTIVVFREKRSNYRDHHRLAKN